MKLKIHSLKGVLFDGDARRLTLPTELGEITVLDEHEPLIAMTKKGIAIVEDTAKKEQFFEINPGFLEVKATNEVLVLAD